MAHPGPPPKVDEGPMCPLGLRGHDPGMWSFQGQEGRFPQWCLQYTRVSPHPPPRLDVLVGGGAAGKTHDYPAICPKPPAHILAPGPRVLCQIVLIKGTCLPAGSHSCPEGERGDLLVSREAAQRGLELGPLWLTCSRDVWGGVLRASLPCWPLHFLEGFSCS